MTELTEEQKAAIESVSHLVFRDMLIYGIGFSKQEYNEKTNALQLSYVPYDEVKDFSFINELKTI